MMDDNNPEKAKISPKQKTQAAAQIFSRLQKKTEKRNSPKEDILVLSAQEKESPKENFSHIELIGDLAKAKEALFRKICTEEEIVELFFSQSKQQSQSSSFLELLQARHKLASEEYQNLLAISSINTEWMPKTPSSPFDLVLGKILVDHALLQRDQIQQLIRIQTTLRKIGIIKSLQELVVICKALSEDIVKPLVAQCEKKIADAKKNSIEQTSIKKQAILSLPGKKYPVMLCFFLLLFLGVSLPLLWLRHESQKKSPETTAVPIKPAKIVEPASLADDLAAEDLKKIAMQKSIQEENSVRDLVRWGNFWISNKQQELLLQQWATGSQLSGFALQILSQEFHLKEENSIARLVWNSHWNIPKGIYLKIQVQVVNPFQKDKVYASQTLETDLYGNLSAEFSFYDKKAMPGLYCFRVIFNFYNQADFTKFFLGLRENQIWETSFLADDAIKTSAYAKLQSKEVREIVEQNKKQYDGIKQWIQKKERFSRKEWEEKNKNFAQEFQKIQEKIENLEKFALSPLYPETKIKLQEMVEKLHNIFTAWRDWQNSFEIKSKEFFQEKAQWEISYEKVQAFLDKEEKEIFDFLESRRWIIIQKQ